MDGLDVLLSITCLFGFTVSGILFFSTNQNRFSNRFLGLFFVAISYRTLSILLNRNELIEDSFALGPVSFIFYLIPPSVYLYIRSVINDDQRLRKKDLLHFLLPVLATCLLIFYLIDGYLKTGRIVLPRQQEFDNHSTVLVFYIPMVYHAALIFLMAVIYSLSCWRIVLKKFRNTKSEHPQTKKIRIWVYTILIPTSVLTVVVFISALFWGLGNINVTQDLDIYHMVRSLILIFVYAKVLVNSELLFGLPNIRTGLPAVKNQVVNQLIIPPTVQDRNLSDIKAILSSGIKEQEYDEYGWIRYQPDTEHQVDNQELPIENDKAILYIQSINDYLRTHPFTSPGFNMQSLSNTLNIPVYHLEYLFRYYNKYSFTTFRNVMRVQYVLDCFQNGLGQQYTLEAIGEKAGFTSRTNFFRVFKAVTGNSPKLQLQSMARD